jgi:hypothetical protein
MAKYFIFVFFLILTFFLSAIKLYSQYPNQLMHGILVGGGGGTISFSDTPQIDFKISAIRIHAGRFIDSIQVIYNTPYGIQNSNKNGGPEGSEFVFYLNPNEYITGISIRHGDFIDALRFFTNLRSSALYGGSGGVETNIQAPPRYHIVGFYGKYGAYLDSIGVIFGPIR